MLVGTLPRLMRPGPSPLGRACLISLGIHALALGLLMRLGGAPHAPDGGVPQRLEVRIESRPASADPAAQATPEATPDEGAKAEGNASVGSIVTTPPEPLGEMPLLIEGSPGAARLRLEVDANGKVTAIQVERSSLTATTEQEMIERLRTVRFRPGEENGKPTASRLELEVRVESAGR